MDSQQTTIRPSTLDDLDVVVEHLWIVAAEGRYLGTEIPFDRTDCRKRLAALLSEDSSALLVAERTAKGDTHIVGHITVPIAAYGVADVGMLVVKDARGTGVGRALLDAAMSWAAANGAHKMALEVWPHNVAALALYRRTGFVEEGRKLRHYRRRNGEVWDAVLMGRPLP